MPGKSLPIEQVLTMLAATPPRIAALTVGLAPARLHTSPGPDEWSANEVLAHLRACADVWGSCILAMIAQDRPTLRAVNPDVDQKNGLSRTGIPALVARLCDAAYQAPGRLGTVSARRLVTCGDRDGGGKATRTDRTVVY